MILAVTLVSVTVGAMAGAALVLAWRRGALEDERARSARLEEALIDTRRERDTARAEARTLAATDPTEQLLGDVRAARGAHHRTEEIDRG